MIIYSLYQLLKSTLFRFGAILLGLLILSAPLSASTYPYQIEVQASLTHLNDHLETGTALTVEIYRDPNISPNYLVYEETFHNPVSQAGLITVSLGAKRPLDPQIFESANWLYFKITENGIDHRTDAIAIASVPKAVHAQQARHLSDSGKVAIHLDATAGQLIVSGNLTFSELNTLQAPHQPLPLLSLNQDQELVQVIPPSRTAIITSSADGLSFNALADSDFIIDDHQLKINPSIIPNTLLQETWASKFPMLSSDHHGHVLQVQNDQFVYTPLDHLISGQVAFEQVTGLGPAASKQIDTENGLMSYQPSLAHLAKALEESPHADQLPDTYLSPGLRPFSTLPARPKAQQLVISTDQHHYDLLPVSSFAKQLLEQDSVSSLKSLLSIQDLSPNQAQAHHQILDSLAALSSSKSDLDHLLYLSGSTFKRAPLSPASKGLLHSLPEHQPHQLLLTGDIENQVTHTHLTPFAKGFLSESNSRIKALELLGLLNDEDTNMLLNRNSIFDLWSPKLSVLLTQFEHPESISELANMPPNQAEKLVQFSQFHDTNQGVLIYNNGWTSSKGSANQVLQVSDNGQTISWQDPLNINTDSFSALYQQISSNHNHKVLQIQNGDPVWAPIHHYQLPKDIPLSSIQGSQHLLSKDMIGHSVMPFHPDIHQLLVNQRIHASKITGLGDAATASIGSDVMAYDPELDALLVNGKIPPSKIEGLDGSDSLHIGPGGIMAYEHDLATLLDPITKLIPVNKIEYYNQAGGVMAYNHHLATLLDQETHTLPVSKISGLGDAARMNVQVDGGLMEYDQDLATLLDNGTVPISKISGLSQAARLQIGKEGGLMPYDARLQALFNNNNQIPVSLIAGFNQINGAMAFDEHLANLLTSDGKVPSNKLEGLGQAAYLNIDTQGGVMAYDPHLAQLLNPNDHSVPADRISGLGSAAYAPIGAEGVMAHDPALAFLLDDKNNVPISRISGLGLAATKSVGVPGGLLRYDTHLDHLLNDDGQLPLDKIQGLGSAAQKEVQVAGGVMAYDERLATLLENGQVPLTKISGLSDAASAPIGEEGGLMPFDSRLQDLFNDNDQISVSLISGFNQINGAMSYDPHLASLLNDEGIVHIQHLPLGINGVMAYSEQLDHLLDHNHQVPVSKISGLGVAASYDHRLNGLLNTNGKVLFSNVQGLGDAASKALGEGGVMPYDHALFNLLDKNTGKLPATKLDDINVINGIMGYDPDLASLLTPDGRVPISKLTKVNEDGGLMGYDPNLDTLLSAEGKVPFNHVLELGEAAKKSVDRPGGLMSYDPDLADLLQEGMIPASKIVGINSEGGLMSYNAHLATLLTNDGKVPVSHIDGLSNLGFITPQDPRLNNARRPLLSEEQNGDLMYYNDGWVRLEKGKDDQVLSLSSGQPTWMDLIDTNTQLSKKDIQDMGFIEVDSDTQLTESQVDEFVANNGYLTSYTDTNTQLTESQVDAFVDNNGYLTSYTDTKLSDSDIATMGYIKTDTNTQLTESQVDEFVANNGYLTSYTDTKLSDSDIATMGYIKTDTNTQLTESQVDKFVANNGYLTSYTDTNTQLTESQVDAFVDNNGYLTSYTDTKLSDSDIATMGYIKTDTNTQLSKEDVIEFVEEDGYLKSVSNDQINDDAAIAFSKLAISSNNIKDLGFYDIEKLEQYISDHYISLEKHQTLEAGYKVLLAEVSELKNTLTALQAQYTRLADIIEHFHENAFKIDPDKPHTPAPTPIYKPPSNIKPISVTPSTPLTYQRPISSTSPPVRSIGQDIQQTGNKILNHFHLH